MEYEEVRIWRDVCEYLYHWKYLDKGRWTTQGLKTGEIRVKDCDRVLGRGSEARSHRQLLWDKWQIQLVRWVHDVSNTNQEWVLKPNWWVHDVSNTNQGWVLKPNWEHKIDFLEKVVLLDANPYSLPMPWLDASKPKPWDCVIGGFSPTKYDAVLGGKNDCM